MSQVDGLRFSPKALEKETAAPSIPPFPKMAVLGRPPTFRMMDTTVEMPGERNNSEWRASFAWFQMYLLSSGLDVSGTLGLG